jgi:hypothetical protein
MVVTDLIIRPAHIGCATRGAGYSRLFQLARLRMPGHFFGNNDISAVGERD